MQLAEVIKRLEPALMKDSQGRYCLICKKASVIFKLRGHPCRLRFVAHDKIAFRTDDQGLTVEQFETGVVQRRVLWDDIECLMAGEPESDNRSLFQG
jgi:hypothetical protein